MPSIWQSFGEKILNKNLDRTGKLVASDRTVLAMKWIGAKRSFIKCSVSNKLGDGSEDYMVNIQRRKTK